MPLGCSNIFQVQHCVERASSSSKEKKKKEKEKEVNKQEQKMIGVNNVLCALLELEGSIYKRVNFLCDSV